MMVMCYALYSHGNVDPIKSAGCDKYKKCFIWLGSACQLLQVLSTREVNHIPSWAHGELCYAKHKEIPSYQMLQAGLLLLLPLYVCPKPTNIIFSTCNVILFSLYCHDLYRRTWPQLKTKYCE